MMLPSHFQSDEVVRTSGSFDATVDANPHTEVLVEVALQESCGQPVGITLHISHVSGELLMLRLIDDWSLSSISTV